VSPPVAIRPASSDDAGIVATLVTAAGLPPDGLGDAWLTLVAQEADGLVGVTALERQESCPETARAYLRT
jgi:hypothetical protein